MYIQKIKLENFRNYDRQELEINKGLNIFIGDNAQGKTNVIESIYLSSIGKSFRTNKDYELIKFDKDYFNIDIQYFKNDRENNINILLENNKNKIVKVNQIKIDKLSQMIGNINVILFSPDELKIVKQSPSIRRRFFDISISQVKTIYLYYMLQYNKILNQRNNLLKQISKNRSLLDTIDIWNEKLIEVGLKIIDIRKEYIDKISKILKDKHMQLSEEKEELNLRYIPNCENKEMFKEKLEKNLQYDIDRGYTNNGPHKDDYCFYINSLDLSKFGSQGQQRSSILSYKLAEIDNLYDEFGEYPILLLDDVASELDNNRISRLLDNLKTHQTIITCTDIDNFKLLSDYKLFVVKNGEVEEVEK